MQLCHDLKPLIWTWFDKFVKKHQNVQELKERAIIAAGLFVAFCGNYLQSKVPEIISLLIERSRNEVTRIYAIRALEVVVQSPLKIDLNPSTFSALLPILSESLRKNLQSLKIAILSLLATLFKSYEYPGIESDALVTVLGEIAILIDNDDLLVAKFALRCYALAFAKYPNAAASHVQNVLGQFVKLMKAAVLQGPLLNSALEMIEALVRSNVPGKPHFEDLLDQITAPVYDSQLPRQAFSAISATTAVVASASQNLEQAVHLATKLSEQLANRSSTDAIRLFSLLSLGELGRRCSEVYASNAIKAEPLIMEAFNSQNEDLKSGASYALGGMAVGNLPKFLPFILQQMQESKRQFLLLHAIKEIILCEGQSKESYEAFQQHIVQIWNVLLIHAESAEESTRNVVSECIGKLCVLQPELVGELKKQLNSSSANVRLVVITSIKYMVSVEKKPVDDQLAVWIPNVLALVNEEDLNQRRHVFNTVSCIAHSKPALVRNHLDKIMAVIYHETKVRKELIKEVEMGPFKHQVDNGLDLRKAAFECMFTLLGSCLEKLDVFEFISHLEDGLRDSHHDIRLLAYVNLSKLATLTPAHVMQRLDRICEPLKAQLLFKAKTNAVKQDFDKYDDLKRAAIRTWLILQEMPEGSRQPQLVDIHHTIKGTAELKDMLTAIEKDSQRVYYGDLSMDTN
ncbi:unnamed protein product, partial [Mesorhabditis belari]|uniref:TATA-binding protein interacting (TIP20) domain-containing protein n=1 Tax=Mesorhabditis belari TaxID=2138241 RepID=A0AAF3FQW5_9BILA